MPTNRNSESSGDNDDNLPRLGDVLSGRLSDIDLDAVEAVRNEREPE